MSEEPVQTLALFYSYAQQDEALRATLEVHLSQLVRQQQLVSWHQQMLVAGQDRLLEIDLHLRTAQIILLLVSPDFLASDYCYSVEMQHALARHQAAEARVIPILLRPADWTGTPFADLQPLPDNRVAITRWQDQDEAFLNVARGIRQAIADLHTRSPLLQTGQSAATQPAQPSLGAPALAERRSVGQARPAMVFLSYAHEDVVAVRDLQFQLNLRGVRTWHDEMNRAPGSLTTSEIERAIEHEVDALALYLTPASLTSPVLWSSEVSAALRRSERDAGFSLVPILHGLSFADLRQFCADHDLPDLTRLHGIQQLALATTPTGSVRGEAFREVARRLLRAALTTRLRRIGADQDRTYEPWFCLKTFAYEPPASSLDLDLNWLALVQEKGHVPTPEEWERILLPALLDVKQTVSALFPARRLHLFVQSILSVALAFGFIFPKNAHFTLLLEGQHGTWSSATSSRPGKPLHCLWLLRDQEVAPRVAVVELAISRKTAERTAEALARLGVVPGYHVRCELPGGPSPESVKSASHAMAMARQIGRLCRELCDAQGVTQIHLFAALPAALAVMVGYQLNALCPITVYEFSQGTYQPVGTLRSPK